MGLEVYRLGGFAASEANVSKSWKEYRYQWEVLGCRLLEEAIPLLSRRGCIALGQVLGALAYWFDFRGRPIALANISLALGHRLTEEQQRLVVRMSYQNFAGTMLSLFWSPRITGANAHEFIEAVGFESAIEKASQEGRGIVFVCAHQGNWEWASIAFSMAGGRASIVAEDFKNKALTELFCRLRGRGEHTIVAQDKSMLKLLRAVLRGETAALLGDLNLEPCGAAVVIRAFNKGGIPLEVCATRMHAVLAKRGCALLVPALTFPLSGGRWRVVAQPAIEAEALSDRAIAQKTWEVFEKNITERPDLWLWAYKHFKFRPVAPARQYPFYSGPHPEYETMREEET
jgi:Kdo2-lipid IVA lauroyltransferase/acyltransferase